MIGCTEKGAYLSEPNMKLRRYSEIVGIPYETFKHYVCEDASKRRKLGCGVGGTGRCAAPKGRAAQQGDATRWSLNFLLT